MATGIKPRPLASSPKGKHPAGRKVSKGAKPDMQAFAARRLASLKEHYGDRVVPDSTELLETLRSDHTQETLYLASIPGMRKSIRKGMAEPLSKTFTLPGW